MKYNLAVFFIFLVSFANAQGRFTFEEPVRQRVLVLTDITNEPDDQQSLVRFLVYSNEYDVEGIVATTSTHLRDQIRKDKIQELVLAYGLVRPNLVKHAKGFPEAKYLQSVVAEHLPLFGMDGVGKGKNSTGSDLIIKAVDKTDDRPLWVSVWGGANCLAHALWHVRETRSETEVKAFVSKIRVYSISDQDLSGRWIRTNFPDLFYIVDPSAGDSWFEYYKATWTGISGDKLNKNGPMYHFGLVDNPWLRKNIREGHGPLGENYPEVAYLMEGDTPSFLGLINNGLGWYLSPAYGGWGGRYEFFRSYAEAGKIWTSTIHTQDEVRLPSGQSVASNQATIWRWREAYQHDFAARMDWNVVDDFSKANHNPVISLNGNRGKSVARGVFKAGEKVTLTAAGTTDPDSDSLSWRWFVYKEIDSPREIPFQESHQQEVVFTMPQLEKGKSLHIILEVKDSGDPALFSYRRIILANE